VAEQYDIQVRGFVRKKPERQYKGKIWCKVGYYLPMADIIAGLVYWSPGLVAGIYFGVHDMALD
jgi:hypothetical protein